jgi:hypothetical protein
MPLIDLMFKKRAVFSLICLFSIVAAFFIGENCGLGQTNSGNMIGAYYYAWWGLPSNNHWNESIKGTPFLGYYNSNDSSIANQQISFAQKYNITFFAVSWIGRGTWHNGDFATIDQNLRNGLLQAPSMSGFKFCLFYETVLVKDNAFNEHQNFSSIFLSDINYAAEQYFCNPSYLKVNGSPVFFIYNVPYLYVNMTYNEAHNLLDCARQESVAYGFNLYIIGDMNGGPAPPVLNSPMLYSLNATTSYHFDDQANNWNQILEDTATYYPQWLSTMNSKGIGFVPNAYPGFNNTKNTGVTAPRVLSPDNTSFGQMLQIALNDKSSTPGFVMVTSWNEWMEGTQIEPSNETGNVFLDTIKNVTTTPPPTQIFLLPIVLFVFGVIVIAVFLFKIKKRRYAQVKT